MEPPRLDLGTFHAKRMGTLGKPSESPRPETGSPSKNTVKHTGNARKPVYCLFYKRGRARSLVPTRLLFFMTPTRTNEDV